MTIRQTLGWGNFAYKLNEQQITRRLFVGSHSGGDSAKNFIERFWPKVYKPLVGLSFPDEAESMDKITNILKNSGLNCSKAEKLDDEWIRPIKTMEFTVGFT